MKIFKNYLKSDGSVKSDRVHEKKVKVMEKHRVAGCQISCGPSSTPGGNCEKHISYMKKVAGEGARLILFPELSLSGYSMDSEDVLARADATTPGLIESIRVCAQELKVAVVYGLYERAPEEKVYNVTLAVGLDGKETRYQKLHVPPNEASETPVVAEGVLGPTVADLGLVRLGMGTCFDNWIGESARMAYLGGAEMIHMPFYWPGKWEVCDDIERKRTAVDNDAILRSRRERMMKVFPARALDNALYVVMVDQVGVSDNIDEHLPGKSMAFDPYGDVVAETKGWQEEVLYFEFEPGMVNQWRDNPFFPGRHLKLDLYEKYLRRERG